MTYIQPNLLAGHIAGTFNDIERELDRWSEKLDRRLGLAISVWVGENCWTTWDDPVVARHGREPVVMGEIRLRYCDAANGYDISGTALFPNLGDPSGFSGFELYAGAMNREGDWDGFACSEAIYNQCR